MCAYRFYHGFDNYMQHAFPHDELKPISHTYTDSLGKAGPSWAAQPMWHVCLECLADRHILFSLL